MFLTHFPINMTRRSALKLTASPYAMHAAIEACFPSTGAMAELFETSREDQNRLLWRLDRGQKGTSLYIVSQSKPSLIGLDEQLGFPDIESQYRVYDYDTFLDSLRYGQTVSFRITANPVVRSVRTDKNGHRHTMTHPCRNARQQAGWLIGQHIENGQHDEQSRLAQSGLTICVHDGEPQLMVTKSQTQKVQKPGHDKMCLLVAQYDGIATISDAAALRTTLVSGLGRAKAFGCGLMTVMPVAE